MMEEKKMDRRQKYDQKMEHWHLRLNTETEQDLIAQIKRQPSMQGYIKRLIREDIERETGTKRRPEPTGAPTMAAVVKALEDVCK